MADITLSWRSATVCAMRSETTARDHFELELEQFDAEFFIDFISEKLGPVYYNAGEEAIRTHLAWSERIGKDGSEEDFIMPYLAEINKPITLTWL